MRCDNIDVMKLTIDMESKPCDKNRDSGEKIKGSDLREIG